MVCVHLWVSKVDSIPYCEIGDGSGAGRFGSILCPTIVAPNLQPMVAMAVRNVRTGTPSVYVEQHSIYPLRFAHASEDVPLPCGFDLHSMAYKLVAPSCVHFVDLACYYFDETPSMAVAAEPLSLD